MRTGFCSPVEFLLQEVITVSIRDILVHVDHQESSERILRIAMALAQKLGAHLAALYVKNPIEYPVYADVTIPQSVFDQAEEFEQEKLKASKLQFEKITHGKQILVEWKQEEGRTVAKLIEQSAFCDLLLVRQTSPSNQSDIDEDVAERVVLESGRPILVIPESVTENIGLDRVVVAWNGKKEAVRAIHDAMPLLEIASKVSIVSVKTSPAEDIPCADIAKHLARHGVNLEVEQPDQDIVDVGYWLQSQLDEKKTDLVVMGAYGHSRYREMIFGGVTRHMLRNMPIPCLMSH